VGSEAITRKDNEKPGDINKCHETHNKIFIQKVILIVAFQENDIL
jgi:hypothetical protein